LNFDFHSIFPLEIFPQGGLTSSVITTAWVGIFVVCFFNLRFGWVLSGLIVPGYLTPLLLVNPWSAVVTIFEGIITYLIVYVGSEKIPRNWYWSSLFGRDRFFALVVVSVIVRIIFDVIFLPWLGQYLNVRYELNFDYQNTLHSFGLIIVSLIANQFWKSGLGKGIFPFFVTLAITYLLVRYGLMEFTNFTLSNLNYIYEDIAASILASPKAYIILLSAAFIASRMNLRYGWDFNGILIPALLALQWFEPIKILTSFIEALVILGIANVLLKLPLFANVNIEGARKLLLFFNIGFVYKVLLGHFILWQFPEMKITDSYGFGYLLATLIAMKMHDKDIAIRYTVGTLHTSIVAVVIATFIGFMLTQHDFFRYKSANILDSDSSQTLQPLVDKQPLLDKIRNDKVVLYRNRIEKQFVIPSALDLEIFNHSINQVLEYINNSKPEIFAEAVDGFRSLRLSSNLIDNRYLYIKESDTVRGWGFYIIDLKADNELIVEVPYAIDEWGTLESGVALFKSMQARALAVAGAGRKTNNDGSSNVLNNRNTLYHQFYQKLFRSNALQIRSRDQLLKSGQSISKYSLAADNRLTIKRSIPPGLDLKKLKRFIGSYETLWLNQIAVNNHFNDAFGGVAELDLSQSAIRHLVASEYRAVDSLSVLQREKRIDGYLLEWLLNQENVIAKSGTDVYQIPEMEELLFFDVEVLSPILKVIQGFNVNNNFSDELLNELDIISGNAAAFDYQLIRYQHISTGEQFIILQEELSIEQRRFWGTYVFRLGSDASPYMIEIPRPLYEINSFEYAVALFEQLQAKYLLIAGVHPRTNIDGSSDLVRFENLRSLFTTVNQVLMRESNNNLIVTLSIRAFGHRDDIPLPEDDILVSFSHFSKPNVDDVIKPLYELFVKQGISYKTVAGDLNTAGYELGGLSQSLYARLNDNRMFGLLWLSPYLRQVYAQKDSHWQENAQFNAMGISTLEVDLSSHIQELMEKGNGEKNFIPNTLENEIKKYLSNHDIISLLKIIKRWPDFDFVRIIDRDSKQSFLLVQRQGQLLLGVNLTPRNIHSKLHLTKPDEVHNRVKQYINSRIALLHFQKGGG